MLHQMSIMHIIMKDIQGLTLRNGTKTFDSLVFSEKYAVFEIKSRKNPRLIIDGRGNTRYSSLSRTYSRPCLKWLDKEKVNFKLHLIA